MHVSRKHPRMAVHFPITFEGDRYGDGVVSNVSMGGCHVISDTIVYRTDYLTVRLYHSFDQRPIIIDVAAVRWSGTTGFGLEFLSVFAAEQERLSRFLQHCYDRVPNGLALSEGAECDHR